MINLVGWGLVLEWIGGKGGAGYECYDAILKPDFISPNISTFLD